MLIEYTKEESVEFIRKYYEEYEHMENVTIEPYQLYQTKREALKNVTIVEGEITVFGTKKKTIEYVNSDKLRDIFSVLLEGEYVVDSAKVLNNNQVGIRLDIHAKQKIKSIK